MEKLIDILHSGGYSCVIKNGKTRTFSQRGVADLYSLLKNEPEFLGGASVADKVIGKAAAALLILGKIKQLHADVISTLALQLFKDTGIAVTFGREVPAINNRDNTGWCPLETLCSDEGSEERILLIIENFIQPK